MDRYEVIIIWYEVKMVRKINSKEGRVCVGNFLYLFELWGWVGFGEWSGPGSILEVVVGLCLV